MYKQKLDDIILSSSRSGRMSRHVKIVNLLYFALVRVHNFPIYITLYCVR